jgi:hypothetical protein
MSIVAGYDQNLIPIAPTSSSGPIRSPFKYLLGTLSSREKRQLLEAHHSYPASAEVSNAWIVGYFAALSMSKLQRWIMGMVKYELSRSQLSRGLRHEPSSPARTQGSWVRIPLKAWISVHLFCVCVLCVGSGLATGWSPIQGILPTVQKDQETNKAAKAQQRAVEP